MTHRDVDDVDITEALAEWPSPVRSPASWDESAKRIVAQITSPGGSASTWVPSADDELFLPPLPRVGDEPEYPGAGIDLPERRSGSVSPPMAGRSDSDINVDDFGDGGPSVGPASRTRSSWDGHRLHRTSSEKPWFRYRAALFGALGITAAAACAAVFIKTSASAPEEAAVVSVASADLLPAILPDVRVVAMAPAPEAQETPAATEPPKSTHARKKSARGGASDKKSADKSEHAAASPDSPNAMRVAAAPTDSFASAPQRPAPGAVQGALGAVLPKARACLHAGDAVSQATLVFDSSGKVQTVTIAGASAGKPAEMCIRSALERATLPAFVEPTFSATVTVRPL